MIYHDFHGLKLSALGMGTMRLPVLAEDDSRVDETAAKEMLDYCMAHGVNYYDTAWGYHSGNSELVVGKLLAKYPRDSFYLASKFPGYSLSNMGKTEEIFEKQLQKCRKIPRESILPRGIQLAVAKKRKAALTHIVYRRRPIRFTPSRKRKRPNLCKQCLRHILRESAPLPRGRKKELCARRCALQRQRTLRLPRQGIPQKQRIDLHKAPSPQSVPGIFQSRIKSVRRRASAAAGVTPICLPHA